MKISPLTLANLYAVNRNKKENINSENVVQNNSYNPIAYRDLNFTARLFRTPENFYAQPFNKNGMPKTMKDYLNDDFEDRQKMPPYQMLKLVFNDINDAKNLEDVKRLYPDEPLFSKLTDSPTRKARTGILAEIEIMKSYEDVPLFKDGSDNLGLYILKKIYLEGKTNEEINKDFKNDISDHYKGLSSIDFPTRDAFGIRFPNVDFWKSFTYNRANFPYEYTPRKTAVRKNQAPEKKEPTLADILNGKVPPQKPKVQRPPKFQLKDFELGKMTDAFLDGHGEKEQVIKQLKNRGIKDPEKLSFIQRYFGEIMSVTLEKAHASQEMRDFFENYNNLNSKEQKRLTAYWKNNPQMKQVQSLLMSDTIKLFFMTYGADGENDDFKDLLDYAYSIKPERERKLTEHNELQSIYEEIFANLPPEAETSLVADKSLPAEDVQTAESQKVITEKELNDKLMEEALKNGAEVLQFKDIDGNVYNFVCNIDEVFEKQLKDLLSLCPQRFATKYFDYLKKSPLVTYEFKKALALRPRIPESLHDQLMPKDESDAIAISINTGFGKENPQLLNASNQAFAEMLLNLLQWEPLYSDMITLETPYLMDFATNTLNIGSWNAKEKELLETFFKYYMTPLSNKEVYQVNNILIDYMKNLDPDSIIGDSHYDDLLRVTVASIKNPRAASIFAKILKENSFVKKYGGSSRIMLRDTIPEKVKIEKCKQMMEHIIMTSKDEFLPIFVLIPDNIKKYVYGKTLNEQLLKISLYMHNMHNMNFEFPNKKAPD